MRDAFMKAIPCSVCAGEFERLKKQVELLELSNHALLVDIRRLRAISQSRLQRLRFYEGDVPK